MLKDFSTWREYEGASEGSGRSEKIWLVNPANGDIGLFKFPKTDQTTEHASEKIASELAMLLGLSCMKVDIGIYDSRIGSLSYKVNKDDESLIEGIRLINKFLPHYDENSLYDKENNEYYSLEMILKALSGFDFQLDFLKIMIFDFLIGNTDRHHSNWAILQKEKEFKLCPIYDNGSSLCCYIEENDIDSYLGNDLQRFSSLVDTKSRSRIRINKKEKSEPTHLQVLKFLKNNYYDEVIELVIRIKEVINETNLESILKDYEQVISHKRILLIKKFLLHKVILLKDNFIM